ncbi:hypothetical protein L1987_58159 [Smallanthus sonchifolius]|uniref:Uncharacterized protein n=1 Tax=Smallanthus sonchifolius TaxID=185202 RepID=A0ACB9DEH3_9ASTR|nr:hypothetical protein L1987_58159 [Smallanthus sonchifolius]
MGKGIFFTSASMLLAVLITATLRHHHHHHHHPTNSPLTHYPSNASKLLRSNGFNLMANFLHISPELLHSTPQTIFAIPDAAFANLSIPPYMIKHLLAYHISPTKLTTQDLFNKPLKSCLPTLIHHQTLSITKIEQVLEINNVLITHPDLFLQQSIELGFIKNKEELGRVIKFLSSSGFMSFAIGLNSVTDGIVKDFPDLDSVTIFTPPNVALMATSSPLLNKFMRFHMVVQRRSFKQLAGLPPGAWLSTLVRGKHVDITENSRVSQVMSINGVAITAPDLFVSKNFVVHGIARALNMHELSSMSR